MPQVQTLAQTVADPDVIGTSAVPGALQVGRALRDYDASGNIAALKQLIHAISIAAGKDAASLLIELKAFHERQVVSQPARIAKELNISEEQAEVLLHIFSPKSLASLELIQLIDTEGANFLHLQISPVNEAAKQIDLCWDEEGFVLNVFDPSSEEYLVQDLRVADPGEGSSSEFYNILRNLAALVSEMNEQTLSPFPD